MRRTLRLLPAVALVVLAGCGSAPEKIGPSGVDGLTIPTPKPDPADFVDVVDNPWLPLVADSVWTYSVVGAGPARTVTVRVSEQAREVAGVATTEVITTETTLGDRTLATASAWFAQDTAGNVWLFAESGTTYAGGRVVPVGTWSAGEDGAQAGLAMAEVPRVGDGYERAYAPGVAEDRTSVLSLRESLPTDLGATGELLLTEESSALEPEVYQRWYAAGTGLVRQVGATGEIWMLAADR